MTKQKCPKCGESSEMLEVTATRGIPNTNRIRIELYCNTCGQTSVIEESGK